MRISYNWLQEYFDSPLPLPQKLADLLNIRAFEVEDIEEKNSDNIFEIKVTPDRASDCLCHDGIAKEVSVHTKIPYAKKNIIEKINSDFETNYSISIKNSMCQRYMLCEIKDVLVTQSPDELKNKLESIGQRSINTVVDITNLVMHEVGQPMHAFDAQKISGNIIMVGNPVHSTFTTLDAKEINLTPEDTTVQDDTYDLAIAGVKGGQRAEVNMNTTHIILESANFNSVRVRQTSKRTGIFNDSSKRFENGITPYKTKEALELACMYVKKYASTQNTKFSNIIDIFPRQPKPYFTGVSLIEINSKLGIKISAQEVEEIFFRLGFEYSYINTKKFVTEEAQKLIGTPHNIFPSLTYDAPNSFDCSTLTAYLYAHGGLSIPRITIDQLFFGTPIEKEELEAGDLIFSTQDEGVIRYETINYMPGLEFETGVDHVGMYMGNDMIIHTSRFGKGEVTLEKLLGNKSFAHIVGYRRYCTFDEMRFAVRVPDERLDIKEGINLIEEIGRVYGYEHVTAVQPVINATPQKQPHYDATVALKSYLIDQNFDEVITYTFQKDGDIRVVKPLAKDKGFLRTDLSKGLREALDLNAKNKELFATDVIKLFEIGHVFEDSIEKNKCAIGVKSFVKKNKSHEILKETILNLEKELEINFNVNIVDEQEIVEFDLDTLLKNIHSNHNSITSLPIKSYTPFSLYPYITRDIAIWATGNKNKEDIEKIIIELGTQLMNRFDLFDTYTTEDKTSYGYRIVFQSFERTLTDDEINIIMDSIYERLKSDPEFEIR